MTTMTPPSEISGRTIVRRASNGQNVRISDPADIAFIEKAEALQKRADHIAKSSRWRRMLRRAVR